MTSMASAIRRNWRRVVPVTEGCRHWRSAKMSMGGLLVGCELSFWQTTTLLQKPSQVGRFWRRYWSLQALLIASKGKATSMSFFFTVMLSPLFRSYWPLRAPQQLSKVVVHTRYAEIR